MKKIFLFVLFISHFLISVRSLKKHPELHKRINRRDVSELFKNGSVKPNVKYQTNNDFNEGRPTYNSFKGIEERPELSRSYLPVVNDGSFDIPNPGKSKNTVLPSDSFIQERPDINQIQSNDNLNGFYSNLVPPHDYSQNSNKLLSDLSKNQFYPQTNYFQSPLNSEHQPFHHQKTNNNYQLSSNSKENSNTFISHPNHWDNFPSRFLYSSDSSSINDLKHYEKDSIKGNLQNSGFPYRSTENYSGPLTSTSNNNGKSPNYEFGYNVKVQETGAEYEHNEERRGDITKGSYQVLLPDGRRQLVEYEAGDFGFKPKISYDGRKFEQGTNNPLLAENLNIVLSNLLNTDLRRTREEKTSIYPSSLRHLSAVEDLKTNSFSSLPHHQNKHTISSRFPTYNNY